MKYAIKLVVFYFAMVTLSVPYWFMLYIYLYPSGLLHYDHPSASEATLKDMGKIDANKSQQIVNHTHIIFLSCTVAYLLDLWTLIKGILLTTLYTKSAVYVYDKWGGTKTCLPESLAGMVPENSSPPSAANMLQRIRSVLVQIMACCLFVTKPLS